MVFESVGRDILERGLSGEQKRRVGAVLVIAAARISQRLEVGEQPRRDNFFARESPFRANAEELLEAVLDEAVASTEGRRLQHLGCLYASFAFTKRPAADCTYLLDTARRLTYRQFVILASVKQLADDLPDWEGDSLLEAEQAALFAEYTHLGRNRLIERRHGMAIASRDQVNPYDAKLTALGVQLYEGLELERIPVPDLNGVSSAWWDLNRMLRERQAAGRNASATPADDREHGSDSSAI